jgi:hypothetical protein
MKEEVEELILNGVAIEAAKDRTKREKRENRLYIAAAQ